MFRQDHGRSRVRLPDLRPTSASPAIQQGVPLLTVSRQLGHDRIATAGDIYRQLAPDATCGAPATWEAIMAAVLPGRNSHVTPASELT